MRTHAASAAIGAPVARVWAVLADLSNPAIGTGITARIEIDYTRGAPIRTLHLLPALGGGAVRETIERLDPVARVLGYRVIDPGPVPMKHYVGAFELTDRGLETRLDYMAEFDAPADQIDALAAIAAANFRTFTANLARVLGVGHRFDDP